MLIDKNFFIDLLANDGYVPTSKLLISKLGATESLLIGELCSEHKYWNNKIKDFNGWFSSTIENIENNCGLGRKTQTRIIKKLTEMGLIQTKNIGLPAKRHFYINVENLIKLFNIQETYSNNNLNNYQNFFIDIISNDGYVPTSKLLISKLGVTESLLIGELCSEHKYWNNKIKDFNGWFSSTIENIENNCGLGRKTQTRIIKKLTEMGLIQTKNIGLPAKRHFYINVENLIKLFNIQEDTNHQTSCSNKIVQKGQTEQKSYQFNDNLCKNFPKNHNKDISDCPKGTNCKNQDEQVSMSKRDVLYNNNIYNNINNNNNNNTSSYNSTCSIPTLEEVLNFAKCYVGKLYIDPENFYWQNERNGWIDHEGNPIKNWKGLFDTWNKLKQEKVLKQEKEKQLKHQKQDQKIKKIKEKEAISKKQYADYATKHTQLECPHCGRKYPDKNVYYDAVNNEMICYKCDIRWKATISGGSNEQALRKVV